MTVNVEEDQLIFQFAHPEHLSDTTKIHFSLFEDFSLILTAQTLLLNHMETYHSQKEMTS